jgi:hypothetical protein
VNRPRTITIKRIYFLVPLLFALALGACSTPAPDRLPPVAQADVAALEARILALSPTVDPAEAARAAWVAYHYPRQLAVEYGITDPPLIHNTKVNAGKRPRGLCWHWAEDMQKRLAAEHFQTLDLHRAIANSDVAFRIDHSTVLVSQKGGTLQEAIILDPWRFGGPLYWGTIAGDTKYKWLPQSDVLERRALELG